MTDTPRDEARSRRGGWLIGGFLFAVALLVFGPRLWTPSLPTLAATEHRGYRDGRLFLEMTTTDRSLLEDFFRHRGLEFPVPVCDLDDRGYRLLGGRAYKLDGRPAAAVAYRAEDGGLMLGLTLPGGEAAREGFAARTTTTRRGIAIVRWHERGTARMLSVDGDVETALRLAEACAVPVTEGE